MAGSDHTLRMAWQQIGGQPQSVLLERLLHHYVEPHRHYHDATHIAWVLQHTQQIIEHLPAAERAMLDLDAIVLAVLCHDVIYDPSSTHNEADSGVFAMDCAAELGWHTDRAELVERLVLATANHQPVDLAEAVVVDADLAILGAQPDAYRAYTLAVRAEYGQFTDDQWRVGRTAVLEHLLATEALFTTAFMRSHREHAARHNLRCELESLVAAPETPT